MIWYMLWYTPYDPSAIEDEVNSWTVAMTLHCQAMQEGKEGRERRERERGNPKAVGTVSCQLETWRHGDMWRDMGDTRGSRAILSPSLGIWETFSCYVSGPA